MASHIRILHGGDFHLGRPIDGVQFAHADLRKSLIDAPYDAVTRMVETAVVENAAAVVLSGNIIDPRNCGGYALSFLIEQFDVLAEQQIPVYWALGSEDRVSHWPAMPQFPSNVQVFPSAAWKRHSLDCGGFTVEVAGRSWNSGGLAAERSWPAQSADDRPLVVVATIHPDEIPSSAQGSVWALGGTDAPSVHQQGRPQICFCGTPQQRVPGPACRGGATWLQISADGGVICERLEAAPANWIDRDLSLELGGTTDLGSACAAAIESDLAELSRQATQTDTDVGLWLVRYLLKGLDSESAWRVQDPECRLEILGSVEPKNLVSGTGLMAVACLEVELSVGSGSDAEAGTMLGDLLARLGKCTTTSLAQPQSYFDDNEPAPWWADAKRLEPTEIAANAHHWSVMALGKSDDA